MIFRTMSRPQWEKKLLALGCKKLEGKGALNDAEWWTDGHGYPFTVPVENAAGDSDFWAIQRMCQYLGHEGWANWRGDPD